MFRKIFFIAISLLLTGSFLFYPQVLTITAGIALFLFGMLCLDKGFRQASSGILSRIINKIISNRWNSYLTGVVSTAILQSSSLISVISVSFVSTGLISLGAGLALMIGSGLGATAGTWLMAGYGMKVAISHYAMPMLVMGTLLQLQSGHRSRSSGYILLGIGFLFLGVHYIREGVTEAGNLSLLTNDYGLLGGILAGIIFTTLMQSSHALLVVVIAAMSNGLLSFDQALALCIGTNIGTTTTAALASIQATTDGRRLALGNLLFKLIPALIIVPTLPLWENLLSTLSGFLGITEHPLLKLALFHSLFNLTGAIIAIPLLGILLRILCTIIPSKESRDTLKLPIPEQQPYRAKLLTEAVQEHPDAALQALKIESAELYQRTVSLIGFGLYVQEDQLYDDDHSSLSETIPPWPNWRVGKLYKLQIRALHEDICTFATDITVDASPEHKESILAILTAGENFIFAIKQLRLLQKSLRRHIRSDNDSVRQHYLMLRKRIIFTIRRIHQLAELDRDNIAEAVNTLRKDLHKQDLLTGDSLTNLLKDRNASARHTVQLINDNGTTHNICNGLIDGAVILLLQGENAIIREGYKSSDGNHLFWQSSNWSTKKGRTSG